jgi:DNA primase
LKTTSLTDVIAKIKQKVKPTDVASMLGFSPKGGMILCPYHDDRSPSMSCHDDSGTFKCFSPACSKHDRGIDILSFYQDQKQVSFSEAVEALASKAGLEMPETRPTRKSSGFPTLDSVVAHFKTRMPGHEHEATYLWLDRNARQNKASMKFRDSNGRKQCPQAFFLNGSWWLSKPHGHKPHAPYHWDKVKDSPWVIICEGEKDVETLAELGLPATTTGSSSSWKAEYAPLFKGKDVIIFPDKDEPGAKYAQAILADLRPLVRSIKLINLPGDEGTDVTDFVRRTETAQQSLQSLMDDSRDIKHVWEAPRLNLSELERIPRFEPDEMLPESLRYWLEYLADDLQAPMDALAAPAISGLSILVGRKLYVQPKQHSSEFLVPAPVWCLLIAQSGQKKTAMLKKSLLPLFHIEADLANSNKVLMADLEATFKLLKVREKECESALTIAVRKKDNLGAEAARSELAKIGLEMATLSSKGPRYLVVRDATPERALEIMVSNPNGVMWFCDELSGWWRSLSMGQLDQRKIMLESWGGLKIDLERKTYRLKGESIVSVVGGVQPDWLSHILADIDKGGKENDGLINRFALIINHDKSIEKWTFVDRKPVPEAYEIYERMFRAFHDFDTADIVANWKEGDPRIIKFSDEAREIFIPWLEEKENRLRESEYSPVLTSHYSKYTSLFCSLALIFHLVLVFEGTISEKNQISKLAAELAKRWCDYLSLHAHKTFSKSDSYYDPAVRSLASKIRSGGITDGMTKRDVQNSGFPHLKNPKKLERALDELCRLNVIKLEDSLERSNGSKVIRINPEVLA